MENFTRIQLVSWSRKETSENPSVQVATDPNLGPPGTVAYHKIRGDAPTTPETPETADAVDVEKPKFEAMPHIPAKGGANPGKFVDIFFCSEQKKPEVTYKKGPPP